MTSSEKPLHHLSRRQIYKEALKLRQQNRLYDLGDPELDDVFRGSIDRFVTIAHRLRHYPKVLDVGAGHGMLLSLLCELGHECYAVDLFDNTDRYAHVYKKKPIRFVTGNVEVDALPFDDGVFNAVVCCQVLEHFTHSHLPAVKEIHRVLKKDGLLEIDVPNAVCFRNRSRMIRGKHITFDYEKHYLRAVPVLYRGFSFYPERHNREFTRAELITLLRTADFRDIEVSFLKSRRHRQGMEKILSVGSAFRDLIPSLRKSLIAFAKK
jgi:ubiquinone/menaquinone biosynthesis C-methylase UbiE